MNFTGFYSIFGGDATPKGLSCPYFCGTYFSLNAPFDSVNFNGLCGYDML